MTPEEANVVRRARAVMLDFDGPVCDAFAGYPAHEVARDMLVRACEDGVSVSESAAAETDPMEVLRYLFEVAPERQPTSERMLRDAEVLSVGEAVPTPGAVDFMEECKQAGRPLVVVSNNSPDAVRIFLERYSLMKLVDEVFGRSPVSPELMKPHPYLLELALKGLSRAPEECLMVGDSDTDIEVAKAVGVPVVGYANKSGKARRFLSLGSDVVTEDMAELADQVRASGSPG